MTIKSILLHIILTLLLILLVTLPPLSVLLAILKNAPLWFIISLSIVLVLEMVVGITYLINSAYKKGLENGKYR